MPAQQTADNFGEAKCLQLVIVLFSGGGGNSAVTFCCIDIN